MSKLSDAIRMKRGLHSQETFAGKHGVTRQTVISWEAGRAAPAGRAARSLNRAGIPLGLLMAGHVDESPDEANDAANTGRAA